VYLLDTDICVYYLRGTHPNLSTRFTGTPDDQLGVTSITAGELLFGATHSSRPPTDLQKTESLLGWLRVAPFTLEAAHHYAVIREHLTRRGTLIGPNDLLIAATALAENATLVTNNVREFSRVPGLTVENWTQ
jgi:tRNA(fMet)-specific endonuclease VapC